MNKRKLDLADDSEDQDVATKADHRKRLRTKKLAQIETDVLEILSEESDREDRSETAKSAYRTFSHVHVCGPAFPRSCYEGWTPPLPATTEVQALAELRRAYDQGLESTRESTGYTIFMLDNFTIYRGQHKTHENQLSTLDRLKNRSGFDELVFDGVLSACGEQRFVEAVCFETVTIEGYGDPDVTNMTDKVCIQSYGAKKREVWYQLGRPAKEYRRFFEPFLWLAQFTKYFVDYLLENDNVTLQHFHRDFHGFLFERYSDRNTFTSWLATCKLRDFRTTIAAHVGFLWKECHSIDDKETGLLKHRIWREVDPFKLSAIPRQPQVEKRSVVTPFAYECFKHMYFAGHLEARGFYDTDIRDRVATRKRQLNLAPLWTNDRRATGLLTPRSMEDEFQSSTLHVAKGDVVCVRPDAKGWKSTSSIWYAYVQNVRWVSDSSRLDVIWLYEPKDTTLGEAYYPYPHELFFSDNCDCGKTSIDFSAVIGKVNVSFFEHDPATCEGLFVRQVFRTKDTVDTYDFVTLKESDFKCGCGDAVPIFEECRKQYEIGDTVLYRQYNREAGEDRLEPGLIVDFLLEKQRVLLRKFYRIKETDPEARPNQLTVSDDFIDKQASMIIRQCHVRYFHSDVLRESLPIPYNLDGAGDFYFIITPDGASRMPTPISDQQDLGTDNLLNFKGWNPDAPSPREQLTGMGIFCGGGNFDRGLEEGGAVEFKYAVDFAEHALHTYRANSKSPDSTELFLGSVDDYLSRAMAGSAAKVIARVGDIHVLAAGSPCPGFSQANTRKLDDRALRNCSLVASVVSYVDFYSPKYCFLENVLPMTQGMGPNKNECVFAQILAAFVAMGYQVQQFLMESWSFGSPQSRARVFIVASAPGVEPLETPPYTHAHPILGEAVRNSKLGQSSNGKAFGRRRDDYTPFAHVSPLEATKDLPDVGDSAPQICPYYPDHRTNRDQNNLGRDCMAVVPMHPRGMGLVTAIRSRSAQAASLEGPGSISAITGQPLEFYEAKLNKSETRDTDTSTVYSRLYPDRLFPTVLTAVHTNDGFNGRSLHWNQPRTLTIMELRRAQGFLDEEVLIGQPNEQVRIIGNSVDRKVAFALGLGLRQSWLKAIPSSDDTASQNGLKPTASNSDDSSNEKIVRGPAFVLVDRRLDLQTSLLP